MKFKFNEEQKEIRKGIIDFIKKEVQMEYMKELYTRSYLIDCAKTTQYIVRFFP
jgi:hypothetical protein